MFLHFFLISYVTSPYFQDDGYRFCIEKTGDTSILLDVQGISNYPNLRYFTPFSMTTKPF
jgi:hypothetical protein